MDNVEPGLNAGMVLDTLAGGRATLLLTSRGVVAPERLQAFPLEPLADPAAVQLFAQRLRQADPARPTPDDTLAVPRLAGLLGGLPLAIELAAAYAGIQRRTLDAIAAEVEHDGLAGGALRGVRPRFERSWQVLTETQQRLFAGLSILEGASFPRDAALAMAHAAAVDPGTAEPDERAAADLDALIGLALVEPQAGGRLRLHPLLREYAAAKLWATPVNAAAEHLGEAAVAYWLAYAEAHPSYAGMDALEVEATGIMGALTWAHDHARHRDVLALAHALNQFWFVRGRIDDARIGWPWALEAAQTLDDVREQRFMLHGLAVLAADAGRADEARAGFEAALALARQLGDPAAQSTELQTMGALDVDTMQQWERARTELGEALALARQVQQPALIVEAVSWLAELDRRAGRREAACAGFRAALEIYTRLGSPDAEITRQRLRELGCDG